MDAGGIKEWRPERIIFFIDLDNEVDLEFAKKTISLRSQGPSRLEIIKQGIRNFVFGKQALSSQHEYAIAIMTKTTELVD